MRGPTTLTCSALGDVVVEGGSLVEEISAPTRATVTVTAKEPVDPADVIGEAAVLTLRPDAQRQRQIALVVTAIEATDLDTAGTTWVLELEHPIALLRLRSDHRTFLDKSVQDIVKTVLQAVSVTARFSVSRGTSPREACVQYGETDYDFFTRLLADEGIFFTCEDGSSPALALADSSAAFTPIEGGEELPLSREGAGVGIHDISVEYSVTSGAVALADYNCNTPGIDLTSRVKLDESPAGEIFEYPGGFATQADGAAIAKIRAEEIASQKVLARGSSARSHLKAGSWFVLTSTQEGAPTGKYLLRRVEHPLAGDDAIHRTRFEASPFDLPFRPRRSRSRPLVPGTLVATVTGPSGQEIHTDKLGRMTALYAFDRLGKNDETSSQWIRVVQPMLGGSMMLARVGWEMAVRHLDGDPDRPIGVARMYDGEHPPPEVLPDNQTKTSFETLTSPRAEKINAITIDDKAGAMLVEVKAAKDLDATILHDETESIGKSDTLAVGKDSTTLIGDKQEVVVEKDDTSKVAKDAGLAIAGDRTKTVLKDETSTVEGSLSVRVDGEDQETVGKDREVAAGEGLLETVEGKYDLSVGGAVTAKAKKDFTVYVAGASSETVGGAKSVTSSDGPLTDAVGGDVTITIGGAWTETVDGNCVASAQGDMERTVGAIASLTAGGKLQVKAKTIKFTVTGAVTLLGGGGVVSVTPASVALAGAITLKGSGGVDITGAPQMAG